MMIRVNQKYVHREFKAPPLNIACLVIYGTRVRKEVLLVPQFYTDCGYGEQDSPSGAPRVDGWTSRRLRRIVSSLWLANEFSGA